MSEYTSNYCFIYSDGRVEVFDKDGAVIPEYSGDIRKLHNVLKATALTGEQKRNLPPDLRIRRTAYYLVRQDTNQRFEIPATHVIRLCKYVERDEFDVLIESCIATNGNIDIEQLIKNSSNG
jgi:hypothetical protein